MWWNILVSLLLLPIIVTSQRDDCSQSEYDRCVRIADPLVKEAHLVFPDNLEDIDLVCTTWNRFVDCLKVYTDNCFTDQQKKQFNRAVESPIESVHQMCMQPGYQKEYLRHAPCIKSTIIERVHCGLFYNVLVDQVEQGDVISKSTLCCSYDRFKQCVQRETMGLCDRGNPNGPATRFATQIIDKALRFLQDQCINYIPNSGDCASPVDREISYSDRSDPSSIISTASSEVYPWSTIQQQEAAPPREAMPSRQPKLSTNDWIPKVATENDWVPSMGPARKEEQDKSLVSGSSVSTQVLGSRTRPASYGRSNGWTTEPSSTTSTSGNTLPMFPGLSSTSSSIKKNYGTVEAWDVYGKAINRLDGHSTTSLPPRGSSDSPSTTTFRYESSSSQFWNPSTIRSVETWYPAAGNQIDNQVDEPNQLGLKKPPNGGCSLRSQGMSSVLVIWLVVFGSLWRTLAV